MPTNTNTDPSSSPTSSKRKLSETDSNSLSNEPDTKVFKQNGYTDNEPPSLQQQPPQQDKSNPPSLSPIPLENKSPNRKRSASASSTSSSSSSSSSSSNSSSSSSSSSSTTSSTSSKASLSKIKVNNNNLNTNSNNKSPKPPIVKRSNGETTNDVKKSKPLHHSLSNNAKPHTTTSPRHRRNSLPIPSTAIDVKAKEARGTLKTCLESMSNFLHQKLNEQSSTHLTIQSPNEEPVAPPGSSSPSFLNDQEQQSLTRPRNTSLDERIRSLFTNNSEEEKVTKELPKTNIRKSLPMPPGASNKKDEHKRSSPKKRSSSSGGNGKVSSKKSSSSSAHTKHSSSNNNRKSSTKKIRESKVNLFSITFFRCVLILFSQKRIKLGPISFSYESF